MFRYALTIFLAALLVFAVQPLMGKALLPWFGGSATVWTTCLLFFQLSLMVGYLYADAACRWLSPRGQSALHIGLLAAAVLLLPILPQDAWQPSPNAWPTPSILLLLTVHVGLPLALLSATTPLVTRWFHRALPNASPYRLFALSNAGSLLGLAVYPLVLEPLLTVAQQAAAWAAAFIGCAACLAWCSIGGVHATGRELQPTDIGRPAADSHSHPQRGEILLWLALSACGSAMLAATTCQLSQEVAVVPLLWVAPLVIYLASFIATFSGCRGCSLRVWGTALAVLMLPMCGLLYAGPKTPFQWQIAGYLLMLLAVCMTCHGELARSQPAAKHATLYYLCLAAGGALGGVLVAIVAPLLFPGYWEYHLGLLAACLLATAAAHRRGAWNPRRQPLLRQSLGAGLVALVIVLAGEMYFGQLNAIESVRNFYGVMRIVDKQDQNGPYRTMAHGRIDHGRQYLDGDQRRWPTLYFGRDSGIDVAMRFHPRRVAGSTLRVGIVGLGTGTIAAHGQAGDVLRYYEINPAVIDLCRRHFTFVSDSPATVEVELGDARLTLHRELGELGSQEFDILVVDAFRNDAIPVHLLTEECGEVYFQHLREDGLLALHLSNNVLDLTGVARGLAERFGRQAVRISGGEDRARGARAGVWVIITGNQRFLDAVADRASPWTTSDPAPRLWRDDFAAVLQVLK